MFFLLMNKYIKWMEIKANMEQVQWFFVQRNWQNDWETELIPTEEVTGNNLLILFLK